MDPRSAPPHDKPQSAPALAKLLASPQAHARLHSTVRQRLLDAVRGRPAPTLQFCPQQPPVPFVGVDLHHLTLGLKLEKVDQALADAYARQNIPRDIWLGSADLAAALATLLTVLRGELIGIPAGAEFHIGQLHIRAAPTVTALTTLARTPVDSSERLLVHLPITLDIDRDAIRQPSKRSTLGAKPRRPPVDS